MELGYKATEVNQDGKKKVDLGTTIKMDQQ